MALKLKDSLPKPTKRVVLLGASNMALSFATTVQTVRAIFNEPIDFMTAFGHGRSYGQKTSVFGRKISGIFSAGIWNDLAHRKNLPTSALLTDIGNDILYGASVNSILEWVTGCLDKLNSIGAKTVVIGLPIDTIRALSNTKFILARTILFPSSRINLVEVQEKAEALEEALEQVCESQKTPYIKALPEWYGIDPIHWKRSMRKSISLQVLSHLEEKPEIQTAIHTPLRLSAYLHTRRPLERSFFFIKQHCKQPSGQLFDGSTISMY